MPPEWNFSNIFSPGKLIIVCLTLFPNFKTILYTPANHQKTHQPSPLTPGDPLEVPLDLLDPLDALLDPLGPLNIPLDLLAYLKCLTNHQRTYQISRWPPGTPYTSALTLWYFLGFPLDAPLDPRPSQITNRPVGHLDLCAVYPWSCFRAYQIVQCPLHLADHSRPIWSCFATSVSERTRKKTPMKSIVTKSVKNTNRMFTQRNSTER